MHNVRSRKVPIAASRVQFLPKLLALNVSAAELHPGVDAHTFTLGVPARVGLIVFAVLLFVIKAIAFGTG
jgi:hypothetical protein